jgi:hypothetical protein
MKGIFSLVLLRVMLSTCCAVNSFACSSTRGKAEAGGCDAGVTDMKARGLMSRADDAGCQSHEWFVVF